MATKTGYRDKRQSLKRDWLQNDVLTVYCGVLREWQWLVVSVHSPDVHVQTHTSGKL